MLVLLFLKMQYVEKVSYRNQNIEGITEECMLSILIGFFRFLFFAHNSKTCYALSVLSV